MEERFNEDKFNMVQSGVSDKVLKLDMQVEFYGKSYKQSFEFKVDEYKVLKEELELSICGLMGKLKQLYAFPSSDSEKRHFNYAPGNSLELKTVGVK